MITRAHSRGGWLLVASTLLALSPAFAAEIAPSTGKTDDKGNEVLEDTGEAEGPTKPKGPGIFRDREEPADARVLPPAGEDVRDDGGADNVPLPANPLLRRAVKERRRAQRAAAAGQAAPVGGEAAPAVEAQPGQGAAAPDHPSGEDRSPPVGLILLGVTLVLGGLGMWHLYLKSKQGFKRG